MNKEKISDALSYLDDDIIAETDALRKKHTKSKSSKIIDITRKPWFKTAMAAAAIIVILIGGGAVAGNMKLGKKNESKEFSKQDIAFYTTKNTQAYDESDNAMNESKVTQGENGLERASTDSNSVGMPQSDSASAPTTTPTAAGVLYDKGYIVPFCKAVCKGGKVSGTFGFDLDVSADYYVEFGEEWFLEMYKGEEWTKIEPKEPLSWIEPVYSVGQYIGTNHFEKAFDLDAYGELKDGKYRIAKNIYVLKTVNGEEKVYNDVIYFDFEIKF
ncbi:MAG: hypothetical protein K6F63_00655 [Lachnospiraceae bacterium]|nr:hypothetical protein [Lachnospiraceae bacterium]